ncbi:MAG: hypothetical protein JNL67_20425 [Planctomycetaceae bacterium]|nr:hypothetical protein [Planctomycetaceae bacterium]
MDFEHRFRTCIGLVFVAMVMAWPSHLIGQNPTGDVQPGPIEITSPLAKFARMLNGEWRGRQYDTWDWGPGKHSLRVITHGESADKPWRELSVLYWHPSRKQIHTLGLNPFERSVSEGTVKFENETMETVSTLYQTGVERHMVLRDSFRSPDNYQSKLFEKNAQGKLEPLAEWNIVRAKTRTPMRLTQPEDLPQPSIHLQALEPFLGHVWKKIGATKDDWTNSESSEVQSRFEWVPYADYVYVRTDHKADNGEITALLETYFYYHPALKTLRFLALSHSGGVYEGDVVMIDGKDLQVEWKGYEGETVHTFVARVSIEQDESVGVRVWSVAGEQRIFVHDSHHAKFKPSDNQQPATGTRSPTP